MEFAVEFATFCNICFRNEGLRKIQESEPLLKVLTLLIENKAIIKRHEIYLCLTCCEKLESYDQFKEMCLRNFLDFRVEYFALKKELEICNNPDIEKKLRNFIESKISEKSGSFNMYDSEGSAKLGNNTASTQSSDKSCVDKQDKKMDFKLTDFYNVACKTEKVDSEYKEEYKLHTESDVENSDDNSELPVPIEHIKLETYEDDTGESESSVRNENRTPSQSTEIFEGEKEFHTTSDLLQYNNPAQTSNLNKDTQSINFESRENECNVCGKTFVTIRNLKIHMRIHTGEKPFTCTICNKSFTQSYSLKEHQVTHTGEKRYSCNVCNKTYSQLGTLKTHQRVHTGIKPHICNICNKAFTLSTRLKKHMLIHTGDKPHACPICKKDFRTSGNLRRHERVHTGEKPYACSMCDKKFTGSGNLKVHERVHTGERPYVCRTCHKAFNHINHLKAHERLHIDEKPYYECKVCNERFTQINSFRMHKATHTGKKPRTCGICKKVFTQTSALKEHERIHTGVKPYSCEICKKTFRRLGNLREHERIHTGVKPYTCKICKKSFRQRCQFRLHEQKQCIKQEVEDTLTEQSTHIQEIT